MKLVTLNVDLKINGPILSRDSSPQLAGVDSPMFRTLHRPEWLAETPVGQPGAHSAETYALPFSHIKGRLKWAIAELFGGDKAVDGDKAVELFGDKSPAATADDPWRGRVGVSDFYGPGTEGSAVSLDDSMLVNVAIDHERKAVKKGAVHIIENAFPTGSTAALSGQFYFFAADRDEGKQVCEELEQGLRWTANYGALRTVGFGRVASIETKMDVIDIPEPVVAGGEEFLDLTLHFRDPFCIAKRRISDNTFESSEVVPGGAIKGAIASMLNAIFGRGLNTKIDGSLPGAWAILGKNFSRLRILHAEPSPKGGPREQTMPLSLVLVDKKSLFDAAAVTSPFLLRGMAPKFSVDWKDDEKDFANNFMKKVKPKFELRVRTAIDVNSWRAAEHELFAYQVILPGILEWRTALDLSRVDKDDRAGVTACLKSLFSVGLYGIGKTKARASVTPSDHSPVEAQLNPGDPRTWFVTLQTPALLASFHDGAIGMDTDAMAKAYADAWSDLSNKALKLKRYYSHESLAGGGYIKKRFRTADAYNPFLLTDAGSVFVLESEVGGKEDVPALLTKWMKYGLPLPKKVKQAYGEAWDRNPYLPENGYGEIAVNLFYDAAPKPPDNDLTLIESPPWWSAMETRNDNIVSGGIA
jgi:hypothetical protein